MTSVLLWYVAMQVFGFTAFPLAWRVCTRLYDRGYALSKALGLLLVTYLTWVLLFLPGASRLWPFGIKTVLVGWALVLVFAGVTFVRNASLIKASLRRNARVIILYELVFLSAFALMVSFRATIPHLSYHIPDPPANGFNDLAAEKFTDFAVLNSLLTSTHFPPHDAWLAPVPETSMANGWLTGGWLNYYYFGHLMWAVLIKATAVRPEVGFNLALAGLFALVCVQAASLGFNLTRRIRWAMLSLFLIALSSNIDGFLQLLSIVKTRVMDVEAGAWYLSGPWYRSYDYWRSSRAVENTITEFPAFSFVLADLHAHVSSLAILLLGFGLVIQAWRHCREYRSLFEYQLHNLDELFFIALVAGALSAANSWDTITFAATFAIALWSGHRVLVPRYAYEEPWKLPLRNFVSAMASLLIGGLTVCFGVFALFLMFHLYFHSPLPHDHPAKVVSPQNRTNIFEFFSHWILLLFPAVAVAMVATRRKLHAPLAARGRHIMSTPGWAALACIAAAGCVMRPQVDSWTPILLGAGALGLLYQLVVFRYSPAIRLLLGLLLVFCVLTCFCEFFYFDDIFADAIERINTVFKIYYGLWPLLAMAAVLGLRRLLRYAPSWRRTTRGWLLLTPILVGGGVYPIVAPIQRLTQTTRLGHWSPPDGISPDEAPSEMLRPAARARNMEEALDGMRYLKYMHPDDYELIQWIRKNLRRDATLLEGAGSQYTYSGRISTMTGRTAYAGWLYHCWGWRGEDFGKEKLRRQEVAQQIYETTDTRTAYDLLRENGIEYVVVGDQEREQYPDIEENKFAELGTREFRSNDTALYKIDYSAGPPAEVIPKPHNAMLETPGSEDTYSTPTEQEHVITGGDEVTSSPLPMNETTDETSVPATQ
jgi:YYY domain-containing protein